jgi:adenylate kinase family enzyme
MATTCTFIGADFKTFKCDDFHAEDDEPMTYQVYSYIHVPNSENISKSRMTLLKGREDDKPMTHKLNSSIHAQNSENISAPLSSKQKYVNVCKNNSEKARTFIILVPCRCKC